MFTRKPGVQFARARDQFVTLHVVSTSRKKFSSPASRRTKLDHLDAVSSWWCEELRLNCRGAENLAKNREIGADLTLSVSPGQIWTVFPAFVVTGSTILRRNGTVWSWVSRRTRRLRNLPAPPGSIQGRTRAVSTTAFVQKKVLSKRSSGVSLYLDK